MNSIFLCQRYPLQLMWDIEEKLYLKTRINVKNIIPLIHYIFLEWLNYMTAGKDCQRICIPEAPIPMKKSTYWNPKEENWAPGYKRKADIENDKRNMPSLATERQRPPTWLKTCISR